MANANFRWEGNLTANLKEFEPKVKRAMVASAGYAATQGESFMKSQAPWTDRTGNARSGLRTSVVVTNNKVAIVFFHSVPYGVFLELRWGGRFAIIQPAMAATGPLWVETLGKLVFH